jgi:hypothetical protein
MSLHGTERERPRTATPSSGERVAAAIPGIVLAAALGVFAFTRFGELESTVKSGRALLVVAGIVAVWLVLARLVLPRVIRSVWVRTGVLSALAVAIVVLVLVPYYRSSEVVERFPRVEAVARPPADAAGDTAPARANPLRVSTGELSGIDHDASGIASIFEQPDGSLVVGLVGIDVQSGPDYFVHVVPGVDRESPEDGVNLGALRGNQGTQYYEIPAGTDAGTGWTVVIWCRAFGVPVANATQQRV